MDIMSQVFILSYPIYRRTYNLTPIEDDIYFEIYTHNINLLKNTEAYYGYSNASIGELLNLSEQQVKRAIKSLVEKDLIYIVDSNSKARKIYLNESKLLDLSPKQNERQKTELEQTQEQLKHANELIRELTSELEKSYVNFEPYCFPLFDRIDFTEDQKNAILKRVGVAYKSFVDEFYFDTLLKHFDYLALPKNKYKILKAHDLTAYLLKSVQTYSAELRMGYK